MAITIGGVSIASDLIIENEFGYSTVDASVEYALDGTPHIWEQAALSYPMDLIGADSVATMTNVEMAALLALANVPGAEYTLSYKGTTYTVRFRNEDKPAVSGDPVAHGATYYNNIRIKLLVLDI